MRRRAALLVVAVVVAGALVMSGAFALVADDTPTTGGASLGASDAAALARIGDGDLGRTVEVLQQHLEAQPEDARGWATLGLAYVEQARITGDPSYYPQADGALQESLARQPEDNSLARAGLAALAAARHEFADALAESRAALRINPYEVGALAVRVDALTELGRYQRASRALAQADRRRPSVQVFARYSYAEELRGNTGRAQGLLRRALAGTTAPADRAYLLSLLADLERRDGRLDRSAAHLREALRADPESLPTLVSRARLALARGDVPTATRRWQGVVERAPLPGYLLELGELYAASGRPAQARAQLDVLETTLVLQQESGVSTDLDSARWLADHGSPDEALATARAAWREAPSLWAADALGWALHAQGRDRAALRSARTATRLGTPDPLLWLHRGTIEAALGQDEAAARHLRRGLSLDPGLNPWHVQRARAVLDRLDRR